MRLTIGILAVLACFLLARNARLADRESDLQRRLAEVEAKLRSKPPVRPPAAAPVPETPSAPDVAPRTAPPAAPAPKATKVVAAAAKPRVKVWNAAGPTLTDAQTRAIEELKKNRDAQTQVHKDLIRSIDERTDLAIRQLLDPSQLALLDAPREASFVIETAALSFTAPKAAYLGIQGDNAPGGGAQVTSVQQDTVASGAGLRSGDVILSLNGEAVPDYNTLAGKIRASAPGQAVNLQIRRADQEFHQAVQLGSRP